VDGAAVEVDRGAEQAVRGPVAGQGGPEGETGRTDGAENPGRHGQFIQRTGIEQRTRCGGRA